MIRKSILLMLAVTAIVAVAAAFMLIRHEPEWTTSSQEALTEFRAGLEDDQHFYRADAVKHYERALEMDPDFIAAKIRLLDGLPKEKMKSVVEDLRTTDKGRLNARERFFVDLALARFDGDRGKAKQLTDAYIEQHPQDAWGLSVRCGDLWTARDFLAAKPCYERLLKVAPNWVLAQNNLGYLEMAQGHFAEAENAFRTYRYIAPDQANPHDSLGELLTLLGRYDEAEKELREAVKVRPDFCASWGHLIDLALLEGDYAKAAQITADASKVPECAKSMPATFGPARAAMWKKADEGDARGILAMPLDEFPEDANDSRVMRHAAAIDVGDYDEAQRIEAEAAAPRHMKEQQTASNPLLWYLQGRRFASQGNYQAAIDLLRKADTAMVFWGEGDGVFKLAIKGLLGRVLIESGDREAGEAVLRELNLVNPRFIPRFKGSLLELR